MRPLPAVPSRTSSINAHPKAGFAQFCERHYRLLAILVLALAAFNLGFRLNREIVTAWDESLYATSAAEMVQSGNWLVTTFHGDVDYYNSKPPLNVWLIATSFKTFGVSLWSLRLPSILAALATIATLQWWCRRCFGATTALLSSIVLSTTFAFLYVHSARSGNPDAWLTLALVLTVVTLWSARTAPARLVWLGPLAAVVFMLKGTAVLMPLLIVVSILSVRGVNSTGRKALLGASVLFLIPTGAWAIARWQFDRWRFFDAMVNYDFVARATRQLEGHEHGWLYYLNVLQKDHYDWLATAVLLLLVILFARRDSEVLTSSVLPANADATTSRDLRILLGVWAGVTLLVPTLMATKLAWYLDPFYPVFAIAVAVVIATAFERFSLPAHNRERLVVATMVLLAFGLAESKLIWYSYRQRDLAGTMQGFILESGMPLENRRVLRETWDPADQFVLEHIARGVSVTGHPQQLSGGYDVLILEPSGDQGWHMTNAEDPVSTPEPQVQPISQSQDTASEGL